MVNHWHVFLTRIPCGRVQQQYNLCPGARCRLLDPFDPPRLSKLQACALLCMGAPAVLLLVWKLFFIYWFSRGPVQAEYVLWWVMSIIIYHIPFASRLHLVDFAGETIAGEISRDWYAFPAWCDILCTHMNTGVMFPPVVGFNHIYILYIVHDIYKL